MVSGEDLLVCHAYTYMGTGVQVVITVAYGRSSSEWYRECSCLHLRVLWLGWTTGERWKELKGGGRYAGS